jgi:peptidoglycan endopeptidase LytE
MKWPCSLLTRLISSLFLIFVISSPSEADVVHIVKKGESLYRIAKKYGIYAEQVQEANELSDIKIRVGQHLNIPGTEVGEPPAQKKKQKKLKASEDELPELEIPETHTVKKGETLTKIANRYHLYIEDLEEINQLQGKKVRKGQVIYLQKNDESLGKRGAKNFGEAAKKNEQDIENQSLRFKGSGFLVEERDYELLVRVAKSFLGLRYRRGGNSVNGMDCSFFVQKVFRIFGIDLPRTAREQCEVGTQVSREALRMGDLVFFKRGQVRRPTHVGIYIGNNQFIHTSLSKGRVELEQLESRYFSTRFFGARRIGEPEKQKEAEGVETPKVVDEWNS